MDRNLGKLGTFIPELQQELGLLQEILGNFPGLLGCAHEFVQIRAVIQEFSQ